MVSMKSFTLLLISAVFLCAGISGSQAQTQSVEASVDRTELIRGETVNLTLRVFGQQGGVQMDLTPLEENFDIIVTRTSSQMRTINSRTEAWTDYILTLFPRTTGTLEIPALTVAGQTTSPVSVEVLPQTQNAITPGQTLFLEAVINKDSIYVQEQLLFNIRLYYTINGIRNPQFTEVDIGDAVIQQIGSANQYEKLIDGVRYGVYEKQYVIFPQRSGQLKIPDIVFRGEVADGSSNFVFRNLNTRTITAFAEGYEITVKERPASFPASAIWLPASNISLTESWSQDVTRLQVGDTVTRQITITANGLDGAALPPLELPPLERFSTYSDPAEIERTFVDGNIVGTRIETQTLVATEAGSLEIQAITLPWWNVDSEELQTATIPSSFIRIEAATPSNGAVEEPAVTDPTDEPQAAGTRNTAIEDDLIASASPSLWMVLLATLVCAGLLLAWSLARHKRHKHEQTEPLIEQKPVSPAYETEIAISNEAAAFTKLQQACKQEDIVKLRLALIAWGRQYYQDARLYTLDDLFSHLGNAQLQELAIRLLGSVYGKPEQQNSTNKTDFAELLGLITAVRRQNHKTRKLERKQAPYLLPPLYKS
ncbi:MAG: BatD family protein [Pseudomonadales bacterium]|nr:BatD family protein [Pseudomonadales bacterium]